MKNGIKNILVFNEHQHPCVVVEATKKINTNKSTKRVFYLSSVKLLIPIVPKGFEIISIIDEGKLLGFSAIEGLEHACRWSDCEICVLSNPTEEESLVSFYRFEEDGKFQTTREIKNPKLDIVLKINDNLFCSTRLDRYTNMSSLDYGIYDVFTGSKIQTFTGTRTDRHRKWFLGSKLSKKDEGFVYINTSVVSKVNITDGSEILRFMTSSYVTTAMELVFLPHMDREILFTTGEKCVISVYDADHDDQQTSTSTLTLKRPTMEIRLKDHIGSLHIFNNRYLLVGENFLTIFRLQFSYWRTKPVKYTKLLEKKVFFKRGRSRNYIDSIQLVDTTSTGLRVVVTNYREKELIQILDIRNVYGSGDRMSEKDRKERSEFVVENSLGEGDDDDGDIFSHDLFCSIRMFDVRISLSKTFLLM